MRSERTATCTDDAQALAHKNTGWVVVGLNPRYRISHVRLVFLKQSESPGRLLRGAVRIDSGTCFETFRHCSPTRACATNAFPEESANQGTRSCHKQRGTKFEYQVWAPDGSPRWGSTASLKVHGRINHRSHVDLEAGRPSLLPSQATGIRSGQLQRSLKQYFGARHVGQIQHQGRVPRKSDTATCAKCMT